MIWNLKTVLALWGYRPDTQIAVDWEKNSSGNWRGSDRGAAEDVYSSNIVVKGPESELNDLNDVLDAKRTDFVATFGTGEEIFGADVDHTGDQTVIVDDYGKIRHLTFKMFSMPLTVRLIGPSFLSDTPDFTKLRTATHADVRETTFELNKMISIDNETFVADHISNDGNEAGIYTAVFTQTIKEMAAIRRYLTVTARNAKIVFPTFGGVTKPFGPRAGALPFNCRIIRWADLGRINFSDWGLSITFARDNTFWNE